MSFIVGFNRDRDSYQVAAALAECSALSVLVTDYYHGASVPRLRRLSHRKSPQIDATLVRPVLGALLPQLVYEGLKKTGRAIDFPSNYIDTRIARAIAAEAAKRPNDDLLVYSNYAWLAFQASRAKNRTLFQYHPSALIIKEAMASDELSHLRPWRLELEETDAIRADVERVELNLATRVLCASNFTSRGLVLSGVPAADIRIVPYGCPPPPQSVPRERERVLLFVGQGVQRKGLHLLLMAWRALRPRGWVLRIVMSRTDPAMQQLLDETPGVEASGAVSGEELARLYATSSALVLPSLVEGFGLVLGEALAHGCSLIASTNTGLPDLDLDSPVAHVVAAGSVSALSSAIDEHIGMHERGLVDARENSDSARVHSWEAFRSRVRVAVDLPS